MGPLALRSKAAIGLCVFDYTATCNHVHLIVQDQGNGEIAASMQLLEGQVGESYNRRKRREGAFWSDRYHATAVESGEHLARCLVYVDSNMVRVGVVLHPKDWPSGGYHEIEGERQRYRIVDREALAAALSINLDRLAETHRQWVEDALRRGDVRRQPQWSESVAVGSRGFVEQMSGELGARAIHRRIEEIDGAFVIRESDVPYSSLSASKTSAIGYSGPADPSGRIMVSMRYGGPTPLDQELIETVSEAEAGRPAPRPAWSPMAVSTTATADLNMPHWRDALRTHISAG